MSNKTWENSIPNTVHLVDNIFSIISGVLERGAQGNNGQVVKFPYLVPSHPTAEPVGCMTLSTSHKHNTILVFVSTSIQTVLPRLYSHPGLPLSHSDLLLLSKPSPALLFRQRPPFPGIRTSSSTGRGQHPLAHGLTSHRSPVKSSAFRRSRLEIVSVC